MVEDNNRKFGGFDVGDTGTKLQGYRIERNYSPGIPKMIQWVVKYSGGYIKDQKQASYVLIGFAALAVAISLFLVSSGGGQEVSPEEIFRNTPSGPQ